MPKEYASFTETPRRVKSPCQSTQRRRRLYSPQIAEELIHPLYMQGQREGRPMTHIVRDAIVGYLSLHEPKQEEQK